MYSSSAFSFKFLFILSVLIPGVVLGLYSYSYEGSVVDQCKRETLAFTASEKKKFVGNALSESGHSESDTEQEEYEIEKIQRPFECIGSRIQGPNIGNLKRTPEYQKLKSECELGQKREICDASYPYRTFDGTCNNLQNAKWGSSLTCANRLFPTYYEGVSGFRKSVCRKPLPNARVLSLNVFKNVDITSQELNTIFTFFAQVVSHDTVGAPKSTVDGEAIDCCSQRFRGHPQCAAPIIIPPNDPHFSTINVKCLNFIRAVPCRSCSIGKRNIMVRPTSYLDCSFIYGSSEEKSRDLRKLDGTGKMMVQDTEAGELLSPDFKLSKDCGSIKKHEYCFDAGDTFENQQTIITSFETIFAREHNRIAGILKQMNPHWREEKLFQETRKIVIAEYQVIVYKELLPLLLGPEVMSAYNLGLSNGWSEYDPSVNPTSHAEFTFAYRLHSLIPTVVTGLGVDGGKRNLSEFVAHSAAPLYHGQLDNLLRGMCTTGSGIFGTFATKDITETLFRTGKNPGIDLVSVDIQRGRDAGMPPYTEVIRHLSEGRTITNTFDDLAAIFQPEDIQLLKTLYCHPQDIDYFVGMHLERPSKNGVLRGSGAEIVAKQFSDFKYGDRFYFEHLGQFNKAQLHDLKKVTLATILCENTNLRFIQQSAMKFASLRNPLKACEEVPKLNLRLWKTNHQLY